MGESTKDSFAESDTIAPGSAAIQDEASSETLAGDSETARSSPGRASAYRIRPSGPARIGRYVIERQLGAGGMGVVFLADDPELKRKVVIKLLRSELAEPGESAGRARLLREAQAMAKVSQANVVPIFDVGLHDDQVFLAMEFIDGGDLAAWLQEPRGVREVLDVFVAAGRGLAAAHRAGLVHRDFKPHNVLIGKDGSVKVTDFGLARADGNVTGKLAVDRPRVQADRDPVATERSGPRGTATMLDSPLTQAGALVGTPAYMAPEQILAEPTDARADQFSFCVALHEALYGARPFAGKTLDELFDSTLAGVEVAKRRGVPAHVRAVIQRGLAVQPADRFASMDALLAELAPKTRRRALVAAAAVVALGVPVAAFAVTRGGDEPRLCTGGAGELAAVWNPARRQALEQGFIATKTAMARGAFAALAAAIDRYATAWEGQYREACEATRVRGTQTEAVMDTRMRCLRRRRAELDALIDIATRPDDELLVNATSIVSGLADPGTCATTEAGPAVDPTKQAELDALEVELAKGVALQAASRLDAANAKLVDVAARADKLGHKPLVAELQLELGQTAEAKMDYPEAEEHFHRAVEVAEEAGADRIRALAFINLITIAASTGKLDEAERWVRYAQSTIERLGNDRDLLAELDLRAAETHKLRGRANEAEATYLRAIERMTAVHGAQSRSVALARRDLAGLYLANNDYEKAYAQHAACRDIMRAVLGPRDIEVAASISLMAAVRYEQKRFEEAMALEEESLVLTKQYFGDDHPMVAQSYSAYALKLQSIGRGDEAIAMMKRSIAIMARHYGEQHALHAGALGQLALLYANLNRPDDAFATWQRALAIYIGLYGEANNDVVILLNAMGTMRRRQGRYDDAYALYQRARAAAAKYEQPGGRNLPDTLTRIGTLELARKRPAAAVEVLEQALVLRAGATPSLSSWTKLELAQALWEANRDRKRAVVLAHEAEAEAKAGEDAEQLELAGKWLATHR